mmetsp:Transcript_592/g.1924  ORF Transcript_592/g.1924 Transcript_592/m.1924 type:complete len:223 (+) Transcript_592:759-1427(+)
MYEGECRRVCDVARASVVFGTLQNLRAALDFLLEHHSVLRLKNRFVEPAAGYVDFLATVKLAGHLCELQLHAVEVYDVKKASGHQLYKWFRRLTRQDEYVGEFDAQGRPHGQGKMRCADGGFCVGTWAAGELHGAAKYIFSVGDVYEGAWAQGQAPRRRHDDVCERLALRRRLARRQEARRGRHDLRGRRSPRRRLRRRHVRRPAHRGRPRRLGAIRSPHGE